MSTASGAFRGALLFFVAATAALLLLAPAASAAPLNDEFANATVVTPGLPTSIGGDNTGATKQAGEPNHAGGPGGHSVWYSWTPSASGRVSLRATCFDTYQALIGVYTGSAVNSLTEVASNEGQPAPYCFDESSELRFDVTAGTTYRIAIDSRGDWQDSFLFNLSGQPANDDFANATTVSASLPADTFGETRLASKETGEPDHAGDPGGSSVWYSWTPSVSGPIYISTCTFMTSLDTLLAVYTGAAVNALTPVASNDDAESEPPGCGWTNSQVEFDAVAGTTYRIAVDTVDGAGGSFSLRFRGRPGNDSFSSPQVLSPTLPVFASGATNKLATKEAGEPDHAGDPGGSSIWYSWTPSAGGPVQISTCTHESVGTPDALLAVYTGSAVNALSEVASNDDGADPRCGATDSEVMIDAVAGTTYRIVIDAKNGAQGTIDLSLERPGDNDAFADAKVLTPALPSASLGTTRAATKQAGEPDHAGDPGGHSVWYSWTPSVSGPVAISVCPYGEETPDTLLAVYTGAAVNALTEVASNDDSSAGCKSVASVVKLDAVAGTDYEIAVDSKTVGIGIFTIEIQGQPANDEFGAAQVLSAEPMMAGGSTMFATKQVGEPNHAGQAGGRSLWFSWTPSVSGPVDLTACSAANSIDTLLAVYTGAAVNALTEVASNDDAGHRPSNGLCEAPQGNSEVVFDAVAGTTYMIAVDAKGGAEGSFSLAFERAPGNDDFADADILSPGLPAYGNDVTKLATKEAGEPNHAGSPGGHSVWYSWTPASSGHVSLSTCTYGPEPPDTLLAVYTGSAVNALSEVASNDDSSGRCRSTDSEIELDAVAGTTYRIALDGKGGSVGSIQLIVEGLSPYDTFAKAGTLGGGLPRTEHTSNRFATEQTGEPDHAGDPGGHSVWFKWTAPYTGDVSIDTCGSKFDTLLAVYTGAAVDALTEVAGNDDGSGNCAPQSKLVLAAVKKTVYRIAVDGKGGAEGSVTLHIDGAPANDDFADASAAPKTVGWYWPGGSTMLATEQAGEPDHAADPGGSSVWYSWTPSKSAEVELEACGEDFDPLLAIYTGATVGALTSVASTEEGSGECDVGRSLRFAALGGTTYRIAVDGQGGDEGHFELHLGYPSTPPPGKEGGGPVVQPPSGGGQSSVPAPPAPKPPAKKPLRCKAGFKKTKVHGKAKCVKKPKKKRHRKAGA